MLSIDIKGHSSVFRWKEIWTQITEKDETWRLIKLGEIREVERDKYCMISVFIGHRMVQFTDT